MRRPTESLLLVLFLLAFCLQAHIVLAQDEGGEEEIDWPTRFTQIVDIKTEPLTNYLKNSKNGFDRLVLARVNTRSPQDTKENRYEVIWYCKGEPVGLRRLGKLSFTSPQKVALRVVHTRSTADDSEVIAAANACLRLFLDLNARTISPMAIIVPRQSFAPFIQRMNQLNFYSADEPPPDTPVYTSIVLRVESEPPGQNQLLFYTGRGY